MPRSIDERILDVLFDPFGLQRALREHVFQQMKQEVIDQTHERIANLPKIISDVPDADNIAGVAGEAKAILAQAKAQGLAMLPPQLRGGRKGVGRGTRIVVRKRRGR